MIFNCNSSEKRNPYQLKLKIMNSKRRNAFNIDCINNNDGDSDNHCHVSGHIDNYSITYHTNSLPLTTTNSILIVFISLSHLWLLVVIAVLVLVPVLVLAAMMLSFSVTIRTVYVTPVVVVTLIFLPAMMMGPVLQ